MFQGGPERNTRPERSTVMSRSSSRRGRLERRVCHRGQVRKGETGNAVAFWETVEEELDDIKAESSVARTSWAFNADHVDGIARPPPPELPYIAERLEHAEATRHV